MRGSDQVAAGRGFGCEGRNSWLADGSFGLDPTSVQWEDDTRVGSRVACEDHVAFRTSVRHASLLGHCHAAASDTWPTLSEGDVAFTIHTKIK